MGVMTVQNNNDFPSNGSPGHSGLNIMASLVTRVLVAVFLFDGTKVLTCTNSKTIDVWI